MDVDPGLTCYYGVDRKRAAHKYCKPIQGYTGSILMTAFGTSGVNVEPFATIRAQFAQCRALTHSVIVQADILLRDSKAVYEDGTTDGGCMRAGVYGSIPTREDPAQICPAGGLVKELPGALAAAVLIAAMIVLVPICVLIALCWAFGCCARLNARRRAAGLGARTKQTTV